MKFKKISRVIALFLAIITLFLSVPITTDAAVATDVPYPMRNNFVLDALQYLGYNVKQLIEDGHLYQEGYYGSQLLDPLNAKKRAYGLNILSQLGYDADCDGLDTTTNANGKNVPYKDKWIEYGGLNCASFVTYVYLNYLPNVAGMANNKTCKMLSAKLKSSHKSTGLSYQSDRLWQYTLNELSKDSSNKVVKYSATYSSDMNSKKNGVNELKKLDLGSKLRPGDIICMGQYYNGKITTSSWKHIAIYLGTYNGHDFVAHCTGGADPYRRNEKIFYDGEWINKGRGPEISTLEDIYNRADSDKFSYPLEYYSLDWPKEFGTIEIQKTNLAGQSLAGAQFKVTNSAGIVMDIITTNADGFAQTPLIPFGTYTVTETNFPAGYGEHTMKYNGSTYNGKSITVTLNSSTKNATIQIEAVNKKLPGGIYGYKTYYEPTANNGAGGYLGLSGATIGLFSDKACTKKLQECTTGQNVTLPDGSKHNGGYVFKNLEVDKTYYVKEITPPPGFELSDTVATVKLTEGGKYVMVSGDQAIVDEKSPGGIYGYKTYYEPTANGGAGGYLGLSGATIGLFSDKACTKKLQECVTGQIMPNNNTYHKGGYVFKDLEVDKTYYVAEITPPPGFELSDTVATVKLTEGGKFVRVSDDQKIIDKQKPGKIVGYKTDNKDNGLNGAVIGIYSNSSCTQRAKDFNGNTINAYTTKTNGGVAGYYEFNNLAVGTYYIKETKAPKGHIISDKVIEAAVTRDSVTVLEEVIINEPITGKIEGYKVDESGNGLNGALIGLFLADTTEFTESSALQTCTTYEYNNKNGYYVFNNVEYGKYLVRELTPPSGKVLNETTFEAVVDTDGATIAIENIVNETAVGKITVYKVDSSGNPLSGATIAIFSGQPTKSDEEFLSDPRYVASFNTSESNGAKHTFENLIVNKIYYIKEVIAPTGFLKNDYLYKVRATKAGEELKLTIINDNYYFDIKGKKTDEEGNALSGAKIGLFKFNTTNYDTYYNDYLNGQTLLLQTTQTTASGAFEFNNLSHGSYAVIELEAPTNYELKKDVFVIRSFAEDDIRLTTKRETDEAATTVKYTAATDILLDFVNEPVYGRVEGKKTDTNGNVLSGATIGLFNISGEKLQEYITKENGYFYFENILPGMYYVAEITPPPGFKQNRSKYYVEIDSKGNSTITLDGKKLTELEIVNEDYDVFGFKVSSDDKPLAGAKIGLFSDKACTIKLQEATTNEQGEFVFKNVKKSTDSYYVKEITPPPGFELSDTIYKVNATNSLKYTILMINSDGSETELSTLKIVNKPTTVIGLKVDQNNKPIAGAVFRLASFTSGESFETTTTEDGKIEFTNVKPGLYSLMEIKPAAGYIKTDKIYYIEVDNNGKVTITLDGENATEIKFVNKPTTVIGLKVDQNNKPLAGAVFGLYLVSSGESLETTTNDDGKIEFTNVKPGLYYLKEIKPVAGYEISSDIYYIDVDDNGKVTITLDGVDITEIKFINKPTTVTGLKVNQNGEPLAGAVFGLFKKGATTPLKTATTTADGVFKFTHISEGEYQIKETKAPKGHIKSDLVFDLTVDTNGKAVVTLNGVNVTEIKVENKQNPISILLKKTDEDGGLLADAEFLLEWSTDGNNFAPVFYQAEYDAVVGQTTSNVTDGKLVTDANGIVKFEGLTPGIYYRLTETKAPNGFVKEEEAIFNKLFSFDDDNSEYTFTAVNKYKPCSISIYKTDPSGKALKGAEFLLEWSTDNINFTPVVKTSKFNATNGQTTSNVTSGKLITDAKGIAKFEGLSGNLYYRLTETKAPKGFSLLPLPVFQGYLDWSEDNLDLTFNAVNGPTFKLPPTGGYAKWYIPVSVIAAGGIVLISFSLLKKLKRKESKNNEKD